ncbi:MAG TPA: hypothetical protein VGN69_02620 [Solirubrobacteraceae bacterium]|jgi:hypothetical protein|nr:hypothetical protein [Solirubrobacteraceae bacterium]
MPGAVVRLPPAVKQPFDVYLNGVPQRGGEDYDLRDGALHFHRELAHEGRLGIGRWLLGAFGIGTYRRHDSVDVRYEVAGCPRVAEGLAIESLPGED